MSSTAPAVLTGHGSGRLPDAPADAGAGTVRRLGLDAVAMVNRD
jgi:hypothetical protein